MPLLRSSLESEAQDTGQGAGDSRAPRLRLSSGLGSLQGKSIKVDTRTSLHIDEICDGHLESRRNRQDCIERRIATQSASLQFRVVSKRKTHTMRRVGLGYAQTPSRPLNPAGNPLPESFGAHPMTRPYCASET